MPTLPSTLSLDDLNERFDVWLRQEYHATRHSAIGQTPMQRFTSRMECIRPAPDNLSDHFRTVVRRRVFKDRTVTINGLLFEAPVALIGQRVDLFYHPDRSRKVEVFLSNKSYGFLTPVDLVVNCRVKRDKNNLAQITAGGCGNKSGEIF